MMKTDKKIQFGDLKRQYASIKEEIDQAVHRVLQSGWYILGQEVERFEREFASYIGADYGIGVGSGTEAIHLALLAAGVQAGDQVITVANTAVPTLSAISLAQARPVFVEIDPATFCLDCTQVEAAINERTKAIVPVHLYGHPCDMDALMILARRNNIQVIEDCAQAHAAKINGRTVGAIGDYGCFSFYPSKNLGALGDAGLIVTSNKAESEKLIKLRNYGQSKRYYHDTLGLNSRLDELQAAILSTKLVHLDEWTRRRQEIARIFDAQIVNDQVFKPSVAMNCEHVYHLYVIRHPERDRLREYLAEQGIGTQIHYPVPCHLQQAYAFLGYEEGQFEITEQYARQVLSLPNYPELTDDECHYICDIINQFN